VTISKSGRRRIGRDASAGTGIAELIETLAGWDLTVYSAVNGLATRSGAADEFVEGLSGSHLAKGVPVMMLFWGLWFADERLGRATRPKLLAVLATTLVAIGLGRLLAAVLPFRSRPLHTPWLESNLPAVLDPDTLDGWNSMPSDHAVLFFTLAVGFWLVSRWAGLAVLLHTLLVVSLPRIYLGLHFPSDILVGGILGAIIALAMVPRIARFLEQRALVDRLVEHGYIWYPVMFLITYESATLFVGTRNAGRTLVHITVAYAS
jgi:undecaprenyl-diphosphatase